MKQAEAEEASRVKSNFLTTITHELRTPLNAVIGYSEIIAEDMEIEGRKDLAQDAARITGAARHLLGLIDQVLEVTLLEAGKAALELTEFSVRKTVEAAVAAAGEAAQEHGNRVSARIGDLPDAFNDQGKLRLCLDQLLSNAVKFTRNGLVAVTVERERADGREWLRLSVSDTGVGMTAEQIAIAFQPFRQLDGSLRRERGGMGLGLTMAGHAAQLLGGELSAVSEPGAGSTFTLRVPLVYGTKAYVPPDAASAPDVEAA